MTNHPPSVLWHCWLGHQTCKNRRPYNLYCVGADVKPCSVSGRFRRLNCVFSYLMKQVGLQEVVVLSDRTEHLPMIEIRICCDWRVLVNRKLVLVLNSSDDNYVPHRIVVMGGSPGSLQKLSDVTVDQWVFQSQYRVLLMSNIREDNCSVLWLVMLWTWRDVCVLSSSGDGLQEVVVLSDRTEHLPMIEIRIKECQGSIISVNNVLYHLYTVSQKMHQLWHDIAWNYKGWFWWHLAKIFKTLE